MEKTLRGRPRLDIPMEEIIRAIKRTGYVMRAARKLGCSDAYIHQQLKSAGFTLRQVLESGRKDDLGKVERKNLMP
ncbi:MAG: hypothetical protein ISS51_00425 [Dehalococcoidales bacterium]|nr:hypothetical protein [Dehalococcoidales bacterium]